MRRIAAAGAMTVLTACLAAGCGGPKTAGSAHPAPTVAGPAAADAWSDPSFRPSASKLMTVSVAPVPLTGALADRADQGFERAFVGMPGIEVRLTPTMVRQRMNGNRELVQIMNRIQAAKYSPGEIGKSSLKTVFTGREYADFRAALGEPLVVFVPVEFSIERTGKGSRGTLLYRAFEIESGRVLRQCRFTTQSPLPAAEAEQKVLVDLILAVEADFAQHFVAP